VFCVNLLLNFHLCVSREAFFNFHFNGLKNAMLFFSLFALFNSTVISFYEITDFNERNLSLEILKIHVQ